MTPLLLPCARRALVATVIVIGITVPTAAASAWLAGALLAQDVATAPPATVAAQASTR